MQLFDVDDFRQSFPAGVTVFASGSNCLTEIRGFAGVGIPVGVSVPELSSAAIELPSTSQLAMMCDSGAFSEVTMTAAGPRVTVPISDKEWLRRLAVYERLGNALGSKALLVAPDQVGSQAETLRRLTRYAPVLARIVATGARFLVPLQVGKFSHEEFYSKAIEAAGVALIPAFPLRKAVTSADEIRRFVAAVRPERVHLLGMGAQNARARKTVRLIQVYSPGTVISMDSNCLRAKIGSDRPLTMHETAMREAEVEDLYGDVYSPIFEELHHRFDYTDAIAFPSQWSSRQQLEAIATGAGWNDGQRQAFFADPDEFLQSAQFEDDDAEPWIMSPFVSAELDRQWEIFVKSEARANVRTAAISKVFGTKKVAAATLTVA